jgi:energy-coupling factor transporter ATP-binding protein EcfA2
MDNFTVTWKEKNSNKQNNNFLLPENSCRCLIIGESGCGKTNLILKMLLLYKWLDYTDLFVFSKSLHQPEYKLIKSSFEKGYKKSEILDFFKTQNGNIDKFISELPTKRKAKIRVNYYEDAQLIPDPKDVDLSQKNVFLFDDVMTESNQSKSENYFTRGRHNNISAFYISQNYLKLPRQTIRSNCNCLILFSQPIKDLRHIYHDYISRDMTWTEFQNFCYAAWNKQHGFVVIVRDKKPIDGKYLANFNCIYIPQKNE